MYISYRERYLYSKHNNGFVFKICLIVKPIYDEFKCSLDFIGYIKPIYDN